jgi:hypothetical protein
MKEHALLEYKRKYEISRHHAWAGTVFLSLLLTLRYIFISIPNVIFIPLASLLSLYILAGLVFTYRYRAGLSAGQGSDHTSEEVEVEKIRAEVEKKRIKLDKKRAKAEAKAGKR